jgi:hypothetical protein
MSQRKVLYVLLAPCLGFTLYVASFYDPFSVGTVRSSPTEITTATTVTVFAQKTVTPQADSEHEAEEPLQSHLFRPDGLLEVNPNARHPMYDLIERAEVEWDKKLKRQSKSLEEAVAEYERRYHRAPPKGFDDWCVHCPLYRPFEPLIQRIGGSTASTTTFNCPTNMIGYTTT